MPTGGVSIREQRTMRRAPAGRRLPGMNTLTNIPTRVAALFAALIPVPLATVSTVRLTHHMHAQDMVVGFPEHLLISCFSITLLLLVPVTLYLGGLTGRQKPAVFAAAAQVVLAGLALISNIKGHDPSFFPPVASITNLTIVVGFGMIGHALRKRFGSPLWISAGLPISWVVALIGAQIGGSIVVAAWWIAIAWLIYNERLAVGFGQPANAPAPA